MKASEVTVHQLEVDSIKVFISRTRKRSEFDRMKSAIKETGFVPIQVRDISDWPEKERRRPGGGFYRYELIVGEGRLTAARELGLKRIPANIIDAPEESIVGRFLAENMIRKPLAWAQQALLVKADLDKGMPLKEVAARYKVTEAHVMKYKRILWNKSPAIENEILAMSMNEAEVITALTKDDQNIVVSVLREADALEGNIAATVAKAKAIREETGTLSRTALKTVLQRTDKDLESVRKQLKVKRPHYNFGPGNLEVLLKRPEFRKALKSAGVSVEYFESLP